MTSIGRRSCKAQTATVIILVILSVNYGKKIIGYTHAALSVSFDPSLLFHALALTGFSLSLYFVTDFSSSSLLALK